METNNYQNNSEQINDFLTTSLSNIYGSITFIDINNILVYNSDVVYRIKYSKFPNLWKKI